MLLLDDGSITISRNVVYRDVARVGASGVTVPDSKFQEAANCEANKHFK
jgi:hypothetical protein